MIDYKKTIEVIGDYDVVIAGGGPAGICAGLSAKRLNKSVLIIERAGVVGGNLTIGHVSPISGKYLKNTMADEINRLLAEGNAYDGICNFEDAKIKLTDLLAKNEIEVFLNCSVVDVITSKDRISSLLISTQNGIKAVTGKQFIDCTGDGVLSYLAGETIESGRESDGLTQPTSIMFTITGVDEKQTLLCHHEEDDTPLKKGNYLQMCRDACALGELPPSINIVRLYRGPNASDRVVNATQCNKINALDLKEYTKAQIELRSQIKRVVDFLKNNVEGFENITVKDSSDVIGVRETRRVKGLYTITAEDLLKAEKFKDVIVHKAWFSIDIHNPDGAGQAESNALPVFPPDYDLPLRCLIPLKNKNLLVAGRCISGTHRAHASYRVMNIAMNLGEVAGITASLLIDRNENNDAIPYQLVQEKLIKKGIDLFSE